MSGIQNLCDLLNNRIFQYKVFYVDNTGSVTTLKFLPVIKPKLVRELHFDDLIHFVGHSPILTKRLCQYVAELSNDKAITNKHFIYFEE